MTRNHQEEDPGDENEDEDEKDEDEDQADGTSHIDALESTDAENNKQDRRYLDNSDI